MDVSNRSNKYENFRKDTAAHLENVIKVLEIIQRYSDTTIIGEVSQLSLSIPSCGIYTEERFVPASK